MEERTCDMFDCKGSVEDNDECVQIVHRRQTFYICPKCLGAARKLKVIMAVEGGSFKVQEMVGLG